MNISSPQADLRLLYFGVMTIMPMLPWSSFGVYSAPMVKRYRPRKPSKKAIYAARMWTRDMLQPPPQADTPNPDSLAEPPWQRPRSAREITYLSVAATTAAA